MSCCAGMHGLHMPMDDAAQLAGDGAQWSQAACCIVTQSEATPPASLTDGKLHPAALSLAPIGATKPVAELARQSDVVKYPPGARPMRATLTRLCTFLI
jgi:hypothetical protein